jgi:hypothetical protein
MTVERKLGDSSESVTFRLRADLLAGLRKECEREGVTLNAWVSRILGHFMSWGSTTAREGFIPISKHLMTLSCRRYPTKRWRR